MSLITRDRISVKPFAAVPALGGLPEIQRPPTIVPSLSALAHWVSAVRGGDARPINEIIEKQLRIIPYKGFSINDPCNLVYLEPFVHISLDLYAFIAITASSSSLHNLIMMFAALEFTNPEYELVTLHPEHFLPNGSLLTLYDLATTTPKHYIPTLDRRLRESSDPMSAPFPRFHHSNPHPHSFPLNVFLVVLNAEIKFRRYFTMIAASPPPVSLPNDVLELMHHTNELVDLLYWCPTMAEGLRGKATFAALIANKRINPRRFAKPDPATMIESGSSDEMEMEGGRPTSTRGQQAQWPMDMDLEERRAGPQGPPPNQKITSKSILVLVTLVLVTLVSVTLVSVTLVSVTLVSVTLSSVTLVLVTFSLNSRLFGLVSSLKANSLQSLVQGSPNIFLWDHFGPHVEGVKTAETLASTSFHLLLMKWFLSVLTRESHPPIPGYAVDESNSEIWALLPLATKDGYAGRYLLNPPAIGPITNLVADPNAIHAALRDDKEQKLVTAIFLYRTFVIITPYVVAFWPTNWTPIKIDPELQQPVIDVLLKRLLGLYSPIDETHVLKPTSGGKASWYQYQDPENANGFTTWATGVSLIVCRPYSVSLFPDQVTDTYLAIFLCRWRKLNIPCFKSNFILLSLNLEFKFTCVRAKRLSSMHRHHVRTADSPSRSVSISDVLE
ncbi:hypothetical protein BS47DRAFT_1394419 [Hydnum rufescens UP504]|uniref:Uncharacterized protein n=1 Tax=Hydnum rufescens UP504 TaxID=1448309 RepID=A0A9P6AV76_9AGAM|nr:hypothetical protein BS47DRAFT_1394419 [Hydnum rufescens UP504]